MQLTYKLNKPDGYSNSVAFHLASMGHRFPEIDKILAVKDLTGQRYMMITLNKEMEKATQDLIDAKVRAIMAMSERHDESEGHANKTYDEFLDKKNASGIRAKLFFDRATFV